MSMGNNYSKFRLIILLSLFLFIAAVSGCSSVESQTPAVPTPISPTTVAEKHVKLTFNVHVPLNTPSEEPIYLHLLDEVTGSSINSVVYELPATGQDLYSINIGLPLDSLVMYRYSNNTNSLEVDKSGVVVKHRIVDAYQHMVVDDTVVGWNGQAIYQGNVGRLSGIAVDDENHPVSGIVVSVAGEETVTDIEGNYLFEFLPIGVHNLVAYSPDGSYQLFQQQAMIGTDLETNAPLVMKRSKNVQVVFIVSIPDDVLQAIPVRIVGNIAQLGGHSDVIWDGVGVSARNAPIMTRGTDNKHRIEVILPAGTEIHYKYTLGDSIWSAEQNETDRFPIRRLIVPDHDVVVEDTVQTWNNSNNGTVSIITFVPEELQQGEVWIQYRYGEDWMEPIPMWAIDGGKWFSVLTSPLNEFSNVKYRYCLNGDCDQRPEVNAEGYLIQRVFELTSEIQNIEDTLIGWRFVEP